MPAWSMATSFRNYHVAAPLKPVQGLHGRPRPRRLPQLSCCGPIEATPPTRRTARPLCLPQLSCCGPIEALSSSSSSGPYTSFRNYHVAAPLKQNVAYTYTLAAEFLPQLSCCGPIEASTCRPKPSKTKSLPQLSCCGPIEAVSASGPGASNTGPSATIMLRPH